MIRSVINQAARGKIKLNDFLCRAKIPKIIIASNGATLGRWSVKNRAITAKATVIMARSVDFLAFLFVSPNIE